MKFLIYSIYEYSIPIIFRTLTGYMYIYIYIYPIEDKLGKILFENIQVDTYKSPGVLNV